MTRYLKTALAAAAAFFSTACIQNDIPYPVVEIFISGIEGEGFSVTDIDAGERVITLTLDEETDIRNVGIEKADFDVTVHSIQLDKQSLIDQIRSSVELVGTFDLRTPIYTTLSLYQDYAWTIRAEQTIDRRFAVAGQVGPTVFDTGNRTATAYVAKTADLTNVTVTALRFGPEEHTTYSPSLEELSGSNFEKVRFVDVTSYGRTEKWLLYVLHTDLTVRLTQADAWSRVIWLYGEGIEGTTMGFRYALKPADGQQPVWTDVTPTVTGGSFTARIAAQPETTYLVKAYCGDEETVEREVTTQNVAQLPNSSFEQWSTNNDIVYPFSPFAAENRYWDTGNPGAGIAGETLTQSTAPRPGSAGTYGANLKSKKVTVVGIGKFAAGNLFTGKYERTAVTNGVITFGRAFTLRPTALKIWVRYTRGVIDEINKIPIGTTIEKGDPDRGIVYIALGTWDPAVYGKDSQGVQVGTADSPICIDTRETSTFFRPNGPDVVGYGEHLFTESVEEWTEITIPITYTATNIVPTNVLVVCSASRYGDYFTGSTQSEMWLDDFELIYDPLP